MGTGLGTKSVQDDLGGCFDATDRFMSRWYGASTRSPRRHRSHDHARPPSVYGRQKPRRLVPSRRSLLCRPRTGEREGVGCGKVDHRFRRLSNVVLAKRRYNFSTCCLHDGIAIVTRRHRYIDPDHDMRVPNHPTLRPACAPVGPPAPGDGRRAGQ